MKQRRPTAQRYTNEYAIAAERLKLSRTFVRSIAENTPTYGTISEERKAQVLRVLSDVRKHLEKKSIEAAAIRRDKKRKADRAYYEKKKAARCAK